ncbi:DMT family transporter [Actinospongicola halichondriae]|uniref:DMT family transporter n=1 Tax=Actinospongicola halichondriae TaxID=3236844 RepID=UPI003D5719BF
MPAALLVVLAAALWGTTGTAQALGPDDIDPLVVGWARLAIGGLGLFVLARVRRVERATLSGGWTWVAVLSIAVYQLTFFGGVRMAGVALGTAVGIGSAPIWGGLVDWRLTPWRPTRRWVIAVAIAVCGAALVAGDPGDAERPALGLALAVAAGASYAVYAYALQQLARQGDADHVAATVFTRAAVVMLPILLIGDVGELFTGLGIVMSLHLGIVATTLSYAMFTRGVRDTPVSTATLLSLAEPLTAVLLGVTIVGETLTLAALVGIVLLLVGVTIGATARTARSGSRLRA